MTAGSPVHYSHTQSGKTWVFVGLLAVVTTATLIAAAASGELWWFPLLVVLTAMGIVIGAVALFTRLTVEVSAAELILRWRFGWPVKRIERNSILAVEPVRNHWIYGWGIRWIPGGWMWNVWGLDAVQLELDSGRRFRIGTDQPAELAGALRR